VSIGVFVGGEPETWFSSPTPIDIAASQHKERDARSMTELAQHRGSAFMARGARAAMHAPMPCRNAKRPCATEWSLQNPSRFLRGENTKNSGLDHSSKQIVN
jgi:hypothetical protein